VDNHRAAIAELLYYAACAAIVIDRVIYYAVRHDSYPSFVVSRVAGGLLALHSVLVRARLRCQLAGTAMWRAN
jgi:hypothetical protein